MNDDILCSVLCCVAGRWVRAGLPSVVGDFWQGSRAGKENCGGGFVSDSAIILFVLLPNPCASVLTRSSLVRLTS